MSDPNTTDPNAPTTYDAVAAAAVPMSRDEARTAIFNTKPAEEPIIYNGVPCVLREPSTEMVLGFQAAENRKEGVAQLMVNYLYMPDGVTPVFEEGDIAAILQLPFNKSMQEVQNKILALLGVAPTEDTKS